VFVFYDATTWPGANALVPTVGAALMIASGLRTTPYSPQRLLSIAPMVWIGGLSYSIYLWHWPILVAVQAENPDIRVRYVLVLMALSIVPAYLSNRFIENPVRFGTFFKPTGRALGLGLALTAIGVGAGFLLNASVGWGSAPEKIDPSTGGIGAAALLDPANQGVVWSAVKSVDEMTPLATDAVKDRPPFYDDGSGCQVKNGVSTPKVCPSGDTSSDRKVVIIGDSKMAQWQTGLDLIAKKEGWQIVQMTKSACPFTDASIDRSNKTDCREWGQKALQEILDIKPDLVITSHRMREALPEGKTDDKDATQDAMAAGMASYWKTLTDAGIPVTALLDNPAPSTEPVYECVAENPGNLPACAFDRDKGIAASGAPAALQAQREVPGVTTMDLSATICPDGARCSAVIGNVLVYRQGTHLTRTFIDSAEAQLAAALFTATDGKFGAKLP